MALLFADNFNRADSATLGANYTQPIAGSTDLQIVSNAARPVTAGTDAVGLWIGGVPNDQQATLTIRTITGVAIVAPRILLRVQSGSTLSCYEFTALRNLGGTTSRISRWISNVLVDLATENATTWANGDIIGAVAIGSTLSLFRNGSLLLTTTEATHATGQVGLMGFSQTTLSDCEIEEWTVSDTTTAAQLMGTMIFVNA